MYSHWWLPIIQKHFLLTILVFFGIWFHLRIFHSREMAVCRRIDERGVTRRGLRRDAAASYVGVSPTKFDELVKDRRMPKPFHIDGCVLWDIRKLDAAFDALRDGEGNPWDDDQ